MKVYVITKGEYSDYHICAVSLDAEKAKNIARICGYGAEIEEYETDTWESVGPETHGYECRFDNDFHLLQVSECSIDDERDLEIESYVDSMIISVAAEDIPHACKKACDAVAKFRAEKQELGL